MTYRLWHLPSPTASLDRPTNSSALPSGAPDAAARSMISGTIRSIGTDSIVITTQSGDELTVMVTADTKIQQTVTGVSDDLQTAVFLTVKGEVDNEGVVSVTMISIQPEGSQMPEQTPN